MVILGVWQFSSGRLIDDFFISSPIAVAQKLWLWGRNGTLANAFAYTMQAMVLGFIIGSLTGFAIGFLLGRSDTAAKLFDPYITAIYCLPKIALAPLLIMWFGIGLESKVAMAALIVFFLVFLNTFAGVRDVSAIHINAARIMGANGWQLLRYVIFPSAASLGAHRPEGLGALCPDRRGGGRTDLVESRHRLPDRPVIGPVRYGWRVCRPGGAGGDRHGAEQRTQGTGKSPAALARGEMSVKRNDSHGV